MPALWYYACRHVEYENECSDLFIHNILCVFFILYRIKCVLNMKSGLLYVVKANQVILDENFSLAIRWYFYWE